MPAPRPETVELSTHWWNKLREVFARRFPLCRDCADENGVCPRTGIPCDFNSMLSARPTATETHVIETLEICEMCNGSGESTPLSTCPWCHGKGVPPRVVGGAPTTEAGVEQLSRHMKEWMEGPITDEAAIETEIASLRTKLAEAATEIDQLKYNQMHDEAFIDALRAKADAMAAAIEGWRNAVGHDAPLSVIVQLEVHVVQMAAAYRALTLSGEKK